MDLQVDYTLVNETHQDNGETIGQMAQSSSISQSVELSSLDIAELLLKLTELFLVINLTINLLLDFFIITFY
ncbi:hypothetical protein LINGRAPRIM_LOCUS1036, partial [Linum grandiflorum]